jgi:hypothetical protein
LKDALEDVETGSLFVGAGDPLFGSAELVVELSEGTGAGPAVQAVRDKASARQKTITFMAAGIIPLRFTATAPLP